MAKIFLVNGKETEILTEEGFNEERLLQDMLERFPEVIALDDLDVKEPFVVIGREVRTEAGYIDVLCIDGDGVLTVIETKLARNAQIRREVIGQLLEYVAQLTRWSAADVFTAYKKYHTDKDLVNKGQPSSLLELMNTDSEAEENNDVNFYDKINNNLKNGVIKLVIASDSIPSVLKDTVAFINNYSKFDIYVLQIQTFTKGTVQIFVPSIFGHTRKLFGNSAKERNQWTEESFMESLEEASEKVKGIVIKLLDFSKSEGDNVQWGTGKTEGSFSYSVVSPVKKFNIFAILGKDDNYRVLINFGSMKQVVAEEDLDAFRVRLNKIQGINFPQTDVVDGKYPSFPIISLSNESDLEEFLFEVRRVHALAKEKSSSSDALDN